MTTLPKKRLRGHALDKLEALERALIPFVCGSSKSKEIQYFTRDEEREIWGFQSQCSRIAKLLRGKLISIYEGADLTKAQKARLPESVKERLKIN